MSEQETKNGVEGQLWRKFNDDDLGYWDLSFNGGKLWNDSEWNESSFGNFKSIFQSIVSFTNVDDSNQMERNIMLFDEHL